MFEFETFERGAKPDPGRASVTISKCNTLSLNRRAVEVLGNPKQVELLFDKRRKVIGLKPVKEETPNSYRLRPHNGSTGSLVAISKFLKRYGLVFAQTQRFLPDLYEGVMVIDTTKPDAVVVGTRASKANA